MQTIASLVKRLDMSAEEAVETLRKLRFEIEGVESSIDDAQVDMLISIDEEPEALDTYLKEIEKKEEKERKLHEQRQRAAQKAAEKRKAEAKKAAAKKKTAAKKKPAARKKKADESEEEESTEVLETPEAPVAEAIEEDKTGAAESPEITESEVVSPDTVVPEPEPETPGKTPDTKPRVVAEILTEELPEKEKPKKKTKTGESGAAIIIGSALDLEGKTVEIVRADGTIAEAGEIELGDTTPASDSETDGHHDSIGLLADAERRQEEEERRRTKTKAARPLPVPDPDVVAKVIQQAHERSRQKASKPAPAARPEAIDKEALFKGAPKKTTVGKTARKRQKRAERARLIEDGLRKDAAAAVKEFQAGGTFGMPRKRKRRRVQDENQESAEQELGGVIEVGEAMTVEQLAEAMNIPVNELILALMDENILANKNQSLDIELIRRVAEKEGFEVKAVIPEEEDVLQEEPDLPEDLVLRAPVITVMGHVDHGKTSLLDFVRSANVADGEFGGITQHIAAYDVEMPSGRVVFLDTPGHEAFTHMRARGAQITDVVILVVAADDGVKPQTIEAINHAKAAGVPVVVAINKCDKPDAQPDRVRQELTQYEMVDERWGGKTIMRDISAKTGEGVNELLELMVLEAQMLELKANPNKRARGVVIESEISRGMGPVAWVLVQNGTLKVGDVFLCGTTYGRVRTMTNARGEQVEIAKPSTPVVVTGFNVLPDAGDVFITAQDERIARSIAEKRATLSRQKLGAAGKHMSLEDFHERMMAGEKKTLNIIIKADVQGSADVLRSSLAKLGNQEVSVDIVHTGVGGINESDVLLAGASDAVIIGFHITANPRAQKLAEQEGVDIRSYRIIYEAIDEVKHALEGLLSPDKKEVVSGHAEVRQLFRSSAIGNIAGCYQIDGETHRGSRARIIRDSVVVHEGRIASVRRGKDDVRSVNTGFECGIKMERFDDIQPGDIIESYRIEEVAKTLN